MLFLEATELSLSFLSIYYIHFKLPVCICTMSDPKNIFFPKFFGGLNTVMAWKILFQTKPYFCRANIRARAVHYLWLTAVCTVHSCPQARWTWSVLVLLFFFFFFLNFIFIFDRARAESGRADPKETEILEGGDVSICRYPPRALHLLHHPLVCACLYDSTHVSCFFCKLHCSCLKFGPDHLVSLIVRMCNLEVIYESQPKRFFFPLLVLFYFYCYHCFYFPC